MKAGFRRPDSTHLHNLSDTLKHMTKTRSLLRIGMPIKTTYFGIKIGMTEISGLWSRGYVLFLHVSRLYPTLAQRFGWPTFDQANDYLILVAAMVASSRKLADSERHPSAWNSNMT